MEESLYFKPETSGTKKNEKTKKRNHRFLKLFSFLLLLTIIVLIIIWLLRGTKTISGQYPENIKNESLKCVSETVKYEKLLVSDSIPTKLEINAIFGGKETLKNLSIIYTLTLDDDEQVIAAEAAKHAEFNLALSASGYSSEKFSKKFARYDNQLIFQLYAKATEIDEVSAPFLMLDLDEDYELTLKTIEDYRDNYEKKGLICSSTYEE